MKEHGGMDEACRQDSLQGDELCYGGWSVEGLEKMKESGGMQEACRQVIYTYLCVYIQTSGNLGFCLIQLESNGHCGSDQDSLQGEKQ